MKVVVVHIFAQSFGHCSVALIGVHHSGEDILLTTYDLRSSFVGIGKHEAPAVIGRCFAPSIMVMTDFSKNRLMTGQSCFKKQDNLSEDVDFFTFT